MQVCKCKCEYFWFKHDLQIEVPRTPSSTQPRFELMTSKSWHYISCHWNAYSSHSVISDFLRVYSSDIPVRWAGCTIYTRGIGPHTVTVSSHLVRIQRFAANYHKVNLSLNEACTHHCWVGRDSMKWEISPTLKHLLFIYKQIVCSLNTRHICNQMSNNCSQQCHFWCQT